MTHTQGLRNLSKGDILCVAGPSFDLEVIVSDTSGLFYAESLFSSKLIGAPVFFFTVFISSLIASSLLPSLISCFLVCFYLR